MFNWEFGSGGALLRHLPDGDVSRVIHVYIDASGSEYTVEVYSPTRFCDQGDCPTFEDMREARQWVEAMILTGAL